jgi:hypothetical protein
MIRARLAGGADALRAHRVLVGIALSAALFGLLALSAAVLPQSASASGDGEVTAFDVDVTITSAGDVEVVETIVYNLGAEPRHGFTRTLSASGGLRGVSGAALDSPVPVHIDDVGDKTIVRIGDFDGAPTLSGEHTFQVTYTYTQAVVDRGRGPVYSAEIVGSEWDVPIEETTVSLNVGSGRAVNVWCHAGAVGSLSECDTTTARELMADAPLSFGHGRLRPGQTMRLGLTLPDHTCSDTKTAVVCGSNASKT